jgi:hypothetical protein
MRMLIDLLPTDLERTSQWTPLLTKAAFSSLVLLVKARMQTLRQTAPTQRCKIGTLSYERSKKSGRR